MHSPNTSDSSIEAAADDAGPAAIRAFALLSDEMRLGILLALWEAFEPFDESPGLSFSELRRRVGSPDSGRFNYHLNKLVGHFIEAEEGGYVLREAGLQLVRTVIAGSGLERVEMPPSEVDLQCRRCRQGHFEVGYHNEAVHVTCTNCDLDTPLFDFQPTGVTDRTPLEVLRASHVKTRSDFLMMQAGVCPVCSGPVESSLRLCEDHTLAPAEECEECGYVRPVGIRYVCGVCKRWDEAFVFSELIYHPEVTVFYHEHGVDSRLETTTAEDYGTHWELYLGITETLVSTDPVRIRDTFTREGAELQITVDGDRKILDIQRSSREPGEG